MENIFDPIKYEVSFTCGLCGNRLKESASFCPKCGNKVNRNILLDALKNEESRINGIVSQLGAERVKVVQEFAEKEQQIQIQIIQAQSRVKEIQKRLELGNEEIIPDYIKKLDLEYEKLVLDHEESEKSYEEKKKNLEDEITKKLEEANILKTEYSKLLEKVELSELFCPVCGIFVGKRKYCGKCGYLMRKEKTNDVVSEV